MVNSFGQFTGDVRVSGYISQAGERGKCVLPHEIGRMCVFVFLFFKIKCRGALSEDDLCLQRSLLETRFLRLVPHSTPLGVSADKNQWSLLGEMTKRCTACV